MHLVTEVDPETEAILARNSFRTDFADHVAFVDVDRRPGPSRPTASSFWDATDLSVRLPH